MANMTVSQAFQAAVQFQQGGRVAEAENIYRQIIAQQPGHAEAHYMLAVLGHEVGRTKDALPVARRAVELNPANPDFHILTGVMLATTGDLESAVGSFRQAVALRPSDAQALNNLANALRETGHPEEAVTAYRQALVIQPDFPEGWNNLANALRDLGRFEESAEASRKALVARPGYAGAYNNLGNALKEMGRFDEALDSYRQALAFQPDNADAFYNVGNLYKEKGELEEAVEAYRRALSLRPDFSSAKWNLSLALLLKGEAEPGFEAYEARWEVTGRSRDRGFAQPLWDGTELGGRRILLHAEQGLGDTIQFVRYAPLVQRRGGRVTLLCQPELQELLAGQLGIEKVVSDEAAVGEFDVQCPLLSLPRVVGTTEHTVPATVPYITADPTLVEQWRRQLANQPAGLKVGIAWTGRLDNPRNKYRRVTLNQLAPLARVPGVQFYSLQKGEAAAEAKSPPAGMTLTDWTEELTNFSQTAALIQNLDLVISTDTSVPHLAGAMGRPVWVLLGFSPDWRWLLGRADSPWYPTMRLFRQEKWGEWDATIERVATELAAAPRETGAS